MQVTKLNENVDKLFKNIGNDITIDNIRKYVSIDSTNDYGNILHALVNSKYPEEKMFSIMRVLLDNGVKVNYKGKITGYSFIHLALYGYTDNNKDYSYSTDFIVKLINLAKEYDFDVNIKDNDGDSLIHTALASEVYTGDIIPLIDALGKDYNIFSLDKSHHNIYEALLSYKKEARSNKSWLNHLTKEEKNIDLLINFDKDVVFKNINEQVNLLKTDLKDLDTFLEKYKDIAKKLEKVRDDIENYNKNVTDNFINVNELLNPLISTIIYLINQYYSVVSSKKNNEDITNLINIATQFPFYDMKKINELKEDYDSTINMYNERFNSSDTVNKYNSLLSDLEQLNDKNYLEEMKSKIEKELEILLDLIATLNSTISNKNTLLSTMNFEDQIVKYDGLYDLNKKDLEELNHNIEIEINELQRNVVEAYKKEYIALVNKYKIYVEKSLISQEMFDTVEINNTLTKKKREL